MEINGIINVLVIELIGHNSKRHHKRYLMPISAQNISDTLEINNTRIQIIP